LRYPIITGAGLHLSLERDAPAVRPVEGPERGAIVAIPQVAYAVQVPYYDYELG